MWIWPKDVHSVASFARLAHCLMAAKIANLPYIIRMFMGPVLLGGAWVYIYLCVCAWAKVISFVYTLVKEK